MTARLSQAALADALRASRQAMARARRHRGQSGFAEFDMSRR